MVFITKYIAKNIKFDYNEKQVKGGGTDEFVLHIAV